MGILEMLTKRCRAVYDLVKVVPDEDSDALKDDSLCQPYVTKKVASDLLQEIGIRDDWAMQEIANMVPRLDGHLVGEEFVKLLIGTAEMNPHGFEALEARFKREQEDAEEARARAVG